MTHPLIACVIDDDGIYQFYMKKIINSLNVVKKILSFGDGEEAIQFFSENVSNHETLPNVVFLDINMPIMDGWQFIEAYILLKPRIGKKIIIYMVSSSTDQRDIDQAKRISEISDYLIKPVTQEQMKELIGALKFN